MYTPDPAKIVAERPYRSIFMNSRLGKRNQGANPAFLLNVPVFRMCELKLRRQTAFAL